METNNDPASEATREDLSNNQAARESVQRALDQCLERGQLHRLHQWATSLNEICHGEEQSS
jgi:hypothetical protein